LVKSECLKIGEPFPHLLQLDPIILPCAVTAKRLTVTSNTDRRFVQVFCSGFVGGCSPLSIAQ